MSSYSALLVFLLIGLSSSAMAQSKKTETFETASGSVTTTTETVESVPQTISVADKKEIAEIDELAAKAKMFVATFLPGTTTPTLKECDEAFYRWHRAKGRYTDKQVTAMLGAYLGKKLISDFQMEWVVVKDQYGTDYAVRAKKYEVMSFPFSSVSKRVENNQPDVMVAVYEIVKHTIARGDYKAR
jgi:Domain of unknown function (DUF3806)